MVIFLDTSAWIKYFVEEEGTQEIQKFILNKSYSINNIFTSSAVTYAEMHATLKRAVKANRITEEQYNQAMIIFNEQWENIDIPSVNESIIEESGILAQTYSIGPAMEAVKNKTISILAIVCYTRKE